MPRGALSRGPARFVGFGGASRRLSQQGKFSRFKTDAGPELSPCGVPKRSHKAKMGTNRLVRPHHRPIRPAQLYVALCALQALHARLAAST